MFGSILLAVAFVIVAACVGISLLRGFSKSVLRGGSVIIAALASIITCVAMKSKLSEMLLDFILNSAEGGVDLGELSSVSPTLVEVLTQLAGVLIAPVACLIFFFLFWFILSIACLIVSIVLRGLMKKLNGLVPLSRLWAAVIGLVEGIVIAGMIFLPVSAYMSIIYPAMDSMAEQGMVEEGSDVEDVLAIMEEIDGSPVIVMHRTLGGQLVTDSLMSFRIGDENVSLREEVPAVLGVMMTVTEIGKTEMKNYTDREVEMLGSLGDSITESKLMAPIVGDILYGATDAWLENDTFLDMEKPTMGEDGMFTPFMNTLLQILHDDAKSPEQLQKDLHTFADVMGIFVEKNVITHMDHPEILAETLGGSGAVSDIIATLEENESMEPLIPEVMNLGIRAISQVLNLPADSEEKYGEFMDDVAGALNDVAEMPDADRVRALTDQLNVAFEDADIKIDREIVEYYAADALEELVDNRTQPVTADDVQGYFESHADSIGSDIEIPR